jgi:hypothetical protein
MSSTSAKTVPKHGGQAFGVGRGMKMEHTLLPLLIGCTALITSAASLRLGLIKNKGVRATHLTVSDT